MMSNDLKVQVHLGKLSWQQAAELSQTLRNEIMELMRGRSTPLGLAIAESLKREGRSLNELIARSTEKLFGPNARFDQLSTAQRNDVYARILSRAGSGNAQVNLTLARMSTAGRALWVLSIGIAVYHIASADDKFDAARREGALAGAGFLGGVAGGALAGLACGPGAPVCVAVGMFVGGAMFAMGLGAFL